MTTHTPRPRPVLGALVIALVGSVAVAWAATVYDNFDDGVINPFFWSAYPEGGASIDETAGGMRFTIPATASGPAISSQLHSRCHVRGDFDVQVNFSLTAWPATNGVRVSLAVVSADANAPSPAVIIERASLAPDEFPGSDREVYAVDGGAGATLAPGSDLAGALRLTRSGGTITGWAWQQSSWMPIGSSTIGPSSDIVFALNSFTTDAQFGGETVQAVYDNVVVNSGEIVDCPVDTVATMARDDEYTFTINRSGKKAFPIWLTSTPTFDATQIDPATVRFGAFGGPQYTPEKSNVGDVNHDGRTDLKLLFKDVFVTCSTRLVVLTGQTFAGDSFGAFATVTTVGCQN